MNLFEYQPAPPPRQAIGHTGSDTSRAAADSMKGTAQILREKCLSSLRTAGPATADELAERLGATVLSIRPRVSELNRDYRIFDTGIRRANDSGRSAKVWRAQ